MRDLEIVVVPHTHWDREWHQPFQLFRIGLVRLVDDLLDLLETTPAFRAFTLDGQTVLLGDYLEIRPEAEARLRAQVQAGRLAIGPWYVLPDEFLVSGEALIRNLLVGRAVAERFGQPMPVGYCADQFGHCSQLPQLLRGFGIDNAIFSRGLGDEGEKLGSEFIWEGPDGSGVLAIHQIGGALDRNNGYYNAALLGYPRLWGPRSGAPDRDCARGHAEDLIDILRRHARTPYLLFSAGGDHLPAQRELPAILDDLRKAFPDLSFRMATYSEYVALAKSGAGALGRTWGELRGGRYNHLLSGVLSTRIHLKQKNAQVQTLLERWAEPFAAIGRLEGGAEWDAFLRRAWKLLLLNHAHDSICGCSVDQVHVEMGPRFDQAEQLAGAAADAGLTQVTWRIDTTTLPEGPLLAVFNPTGGTRTGLVFGSTPLPPELLREPLVAVDEAGEVGPCQVLGVNPPAEFESQSTFQVAVVAPEVPGVGYRTLAIRRGTAAGQVRGDEAPPAIENDRYRVEVGANGAARVVHRPTGHELVGAHLLVDEGDTGDEYNFCPVPEEEPITSAQCPAHVSLVQRGPALATVAVEQELEIPAGLAPDRRRRSEERVRVPVRTEISLAAGGRWVEFRTEVDNRARDHRLRAVFPTGVRTDAVEALGHFDRLLRPVVPPKQPHWTEPPGPTGPQSGYVAVANGRAGVALLSPELPEYLAEPGETGVDLSLTLLRCVGWLSRSDLSTRPGGAGPPLPAPGAQCPGRFAFRYSLAVYTPDEALDLPVWAEAFRAPMRLLPVARQPGPLAPTLGFLQVEGPAVLSALKSAEDGDGLIARLYNPGDRPASVVLRWYRPLASAWRCRLDETRLAPLSVEGERTVKLEVGRREIATVRVGVGG